MSESSLGDIVCPYCGYKEAESFWSTHIVDGEKYYETCQVCGKQYVFISKRFIRFVSYTVDGIKSVEGGPRE